MTSCLALVACGGRDLGHIDAASTPVRGPSSSTTGLPAGSADLKVLRSQDYVLTSGPETKGLKEQPTPGAPGLADPQAGKDLADCLGIPGLSVTAAYNGPAFTDGAEDPTTANSTSAILSMEDATAARKALQEPRYPGCLASLTAKDFDAQLKGQLKRAGYTDPSLAEKLSADVSSAGFASPLPGFAAAMEFVVTISGPASSQKYYATTLFAIDRRVEIELTLGRFGNPPDTAQLELLATQLVRKLAQQPR